MELWIQLRDPVSMNKIASGQERLLIQYGSLKGNGLQRALLGGMALMGRRGLIGQSVSLQKQDLALVHVHTICSKTNHFLCLKDILFFSASSLAPCLPAHCHAPTS